MTATSPSAPSRTPLSPTPRTTVSRGRNRVVTDRARLHDLLADALVAHVGVTLGGHPVVLPSAYAVDPHGPDRDGTLYLHGSVAAGWLRGATDTTVCVTVTQLDGLVAGRSAFHHSMNYRSAVVIGPARLVDDPAEKERALALIVDHMIPGRSATLRASTRKELAATAVLAVPLHEASLKARDGGPVDEPDDVAAGVWGGHVPLRLVAGPPVPDVDSAGTVPGDVVARARDLAAR
ncbi:pyridoxamine 5'-phosphate oxidase family protein [Nocardioides sp. MAHUQ-72]|uniref:pyridoxamine 5'-phosphate oxidase family protein n=1 Tax=unclassified Nocardioides TaxID=2615069 RepID=UPI003614EEF5